MQKRTRQKGTAMHLSHNIIHRTEGTSALKHDYSCERGIVIEYPRPKRERSLYGRTVSVHMVPNAHRAPEELCFSEAMRRGVAECFELREDDMAGSWNGRSEREARALYVGTTLVATLTLLLGMLPFLL